MASLRSLTLRIGIGSWLLGLLTLLGNLRAAEPPWTQGTGFRYRPLENSTTAGSPASTKNAGFERIGPGHTGILFTNTFAGDTYLTNAVAHNGAGLALGDVDGDGWVDIYFCSLQGTNQLYRNKGGWRFEPMPLSAAACVGQVSTAAAFADVDGDGDLDLLVNGVPTGTRLFLNDGKGGFLDSMDSGLSRTNSAMGMALADIDGDGDLDLYCAHYLDVMHLADPTTRFAISKLDGQWQVTKVNDISTRSGRFKGRFEALPDGSVRELPEVHALYRNDGKGHFTAIQNEPGTFQDETGAAMAPPRDWGLAAQFRDLNGDGAPDLYVCNDNASPDRIWINNGKGQFRALESWKLRHTSRSSMGVDMADVDRDGLVDIFVADMLARTHSRRMQQLVRERPSQADVDSAAARPRFNRNTLLLGRPDGSFADAALLAGVAASDWSWCPLFVDVDLDGYEDLLITNGFSFDVMDQDSVDDLRTRGRQLTLDQRKRSRQFHPHWPTPNAVFRNRGDGTFEPMHGAWGFEDSGISYGAALADLDNDGDFDVVVNDLNGPAGIYRNGAVAGRVQVQLRGIHGNTRGIGARMELRSLSGSQTQEMVAGGRYLASDAAERVFALPEKESGKATLRVTWRNGRTQEITGVQSGMLYAIEESPQDSTLTEVPATAAMNPPLFEDLSARLNHADTDAPVDDWSLQPLLPRRLSQLGPGAAWFDVDGDGVEALVLGAGRGGTLSWIRPDSTNTEWRRKELLTNAPGDQSGLLGFVDADGKRRLLVAQSGYEMGATVEGSLLELDPMSSEKPLRTGLGAMSPGPMVLTDLDGDGAPELFVGGRFKPGRYPEPVRSVVLGREAEQWKIRTNGMEVLQRVGMVSGAVATDLDGDGSNELILACEWGPVRVFRTADGRLSETTQAWGLEALRGWWTSVAAGDVDGDGRMDLICGNWGLNSVYGLFNHSPMKVVYDDWNADGTLQLMEAWKEGDRWVPVRDRTWLAHGLPELQTRFPTHKDFAAADLGQILGPGRAASPSHTANELRSMVLLNRGNRFEAIPLPRACQLAPVFGIATADFNGDGHLDAVLAQNFFGYPADLSRDDAGQGLFLKGTGNGQFEPLTSDRSGIRIQGQQRSVVVGDIDRDGRRDVAVTVHGGQTHLYRNRTGVPGIRVKLEGPSNNPEGIGAQLQCITAQGAAGPVQAVTRGGGYWAQDSAVVVVHPVAGTTGLRVRWPGGKGQTVGLNGLPGEITVRFEK